jgi:hypothetical protein
LCDGPYSIYMYAYVYCPPQYKFSHASFSNGSLAITTKRKVKFRFRVAAMFLLYILLKSYINKNSIFWRIYYQTLFRDQHWIALVSLPLQKLTDSK